MSGRSHLILGLLAGAAAAVALDVDTRTAIFMTALGGIGGLAPDLDHPKSMLSGLIPGSGIVLGVSGLKHRTFTHSLLFVALLLLLWFIASRSIAIPYPLAGAAAAGVLTHFIADMTTVQGIPLLYPSMRAWRVLPRGLLALSSGLIEIIANAAGTLALFAMIYLILK